MTNPILIPDLNAKIELLLRSDRFTIKTASELSKRMDIGPDYLSRFRNGSRAMPEEHLLKLCKIFGLEQREWYSDVETFGKRLGFSRKQI